MLSVLLPVYGGEDYVRDAISSIQKQADVELEIVAIDDGSKDSSWDILSSIADDRLVKITKQNTGLASTLNQAIMLAKGQFLARLDQDDLMLDTRLSKQQSFLQQHADYALIGTWSEIWVGNEKTSRGHRHPTSHEALHLALLFDNPFVHSSVMLRKEAILTVGGYSEDKQRQPPEDYELWSRVVRQFRVANIPEPLTVYREVEGSMSRISERPFIKNVVKIASENLFFLLSGRYTLAECYCLACHYHGWGDGLSGLKLSQILNMHELAAIGVAGSRSHWSNEFSHTYREQRVRLYSQYIRQYLPVKVFNVMRKVKTIARRLF